MSLMILKKQSLNLGLYEQYNSIVIDNNLYLVLCILILVSNIIALRVLVYSLVRTFFKIKYHHKSNKN